MSILEGINQKMSVLLNESMNLQTQYADVMERISYRSFPPITDQVTDVVGRFEQVISMLMSIATMLRSDDIELKKQLMKLDLKNYPYNSPNEVVTDASSKSSSDEEQTFKQYDQFLDSWMQNHQNNLTDDRLASDTSDVDDTTANTLLVTVRTLLSKGEYQQATKLCKKIINDMKTLRGTNGDDLPIANALNTLAFVYRAAKKYDKAIETLFKVLNIRKNGEDHLGVACAFNNLAIVHVNAGKYSEAEHFCLSSLRKKISELGFEHPDAAKQMYNVGVLYQKQDKYAAAIKYYEEVLNIYEEQSYDDPNVAQVKSNLAICYWKQGDVAKAEAVSK